MAENNPLTRRDFSKLSVAALGGAITGSMLAGCDRKSGTSNETAGGDGEPATGGNAPADGSDEATHDVSLLLEEPHICRGLNICKGYGKGGSNECAGSGACASAKAHACSGQNECKGQGGCGDYPGQNTCKGQGGCGVPLGEGHEAVWAKARAAFEKAYEEKNGKPPLPAPPAG